MAKLVVLDAGPLGLLCDPRPRPDAIACRQWAADLLAAGHRVIISEIADYEVRRELLRAGRTNSVTALDNLHGWLEYLPLTTSIMRRAAELWAQARQIGQPTAADNTIDADMILIAQAESLNDPDTIIATTNVGHLSRFFPADLWTNIAP
ncbi:MAG: PIN domain-containing protein [Planctomycetia bacterium]|nr:PIN domain-containing protein [Planctomycetia bacterium]